MLHIVNSLAMPVTLSKSYSLFAGAQDAIVQWWYGHNAVGFLLTGGFLGMLYYFLPKHAERPDLELSAVHRRLLGLHLQLHLGRSPPPALQRRAGVGAVLGHGDEPRAAGALLGHHGQRRDDRGRGVGRSCAPTRR